MMNGQMGSWYSSMGSGNWVFEIVIVAVVVIGVAALFVSRRK